jgi:hypothetical protein
MTIFEDLGLVEAGKVQDDRSMAAVLSWEMYIQPSLTQQQFADYTMYALGRSAVVLCCRFPSHFRSTRTLQRLTVQLQQLKLTSAILSSLPWRRNGSTYR